MLPGLTLWELMELVPLDGQQPQGRSPGHASPPVPSFKAQQMSGSGIVAAADLDAQGQALDVVAAQSDVPEVTVRTVKCHGAEEVVGQVELADGILDGPRHRREARGGAVEQGRSLTVTALRTGRLRSGAVEPRGDEEQHGSQEGPRCCCHHNLS